MRLKLTSSYDAVLRESLPLYTCTPQSPLCCLLVLNLIRLFFRNLEADAGSAYSWLNHRFLIGRVSHSPDGTLGFFDIYLLQDAQADRPPVPEKNAEREAGLDPAGVQASL